MEKKRLLFVNGHLDVGGIEKSLVDLLNYIDYSIYEVDLLLLEGKGAYWDKVPSTVNIILYDTSKAYGPFFSSLIKNIVRLDISYVIYRILLTLAPLLGVRAYKLMRPLMGIKHHYDYAIAYRVGLPNDIVSQTVNSRIKICWWHSGECNYSAKEIEHINQMWKSMDYIVAVSNGCKTMIRKKFAFNKEIYVIPNIIDVNAINKLAGIQSPYSDKVSLRIVTLGRLCWEKHIEDVPDIAQKLISHGLEDFKWYIIGDGAKREDIEAKIKKNELEGHVIMLGRKSNPYPYVKYADIMVHTSYIEAHCLTLLEAMSLHTPCVATKTMLPQVFTIDNENCILVDQNVDSQYHGLVKMINNQSSIRNTMTDNAYSMVVECYSPIKIVSLFNDLIFHCSD